MATGPRTSARLGATRIFKEVATDADAKADTLAEATDLARQLVSNAARIDPADCGGFCDLVTIAAAPRTPAAAAARDAHVVGRIDSPSRAQREA